ncbi:hypothetical protein OAJ50_00810 [Candidatus Nitrosopelagicus sp.]|nr:hypothetical protein [Candidatus Nitrosopelagicus sp.]
MTSQRVLFKYHESKTLNMKSNCSLFLKTVIPSQHRFNSRSDQLAMMTTQEHSSFLRTEKKKEIAPFLRSEGVL